MTKNPLLSLALLASKLGGGLIGVALVFLLGFFIHWRLNASAYETMQISVQDGAVTLLEAAPRPTLAEGGVDQRALTASNPPLVKQVNLNELTAGSTYLLLFQFSFSLLLALLMIREGRKILTSVRASSAFTTGNVTAFRRLGWLCLAMTVLTSVRVLATAHDSFMSFSPSLPLLGGMVAAFVLAEIFKEGHELFERDQLTI